ncbi:MAG: PilZ domain-containing protein, partial [Sandaracinaceae bacterium]
ASPPASSPAQPSFQPAPQGPPPAAPHPPAGQRSAPAAAPGGYPPPAGSSPAWSDPARAPTVGSAPGAGAIGSAPTTPSYRDAGARADVEANLGVTTESNVFVGFSGEVREGGVFVATYNIHPVGTRVRMLITLPGGLSTEVDGHVRFVRDPMDMASDAQPGMGVGFDGLSPHARELLLRFIRNRPPMFYDV